jgi:hypothetical protein
MRMRVEKDYEELLELFNKYSVKYCIIGAYALAFHVRPRYTKDMDILVEPSRENAGRILGALRDFGFGALALSEKDFTELGQIIQLGFEPVRIDLITSIEGLDFQKVWNNRKMGLFGEQQVPFIGLEDLIACKRISHRSQDRADLELLQEVLDKTNE